MPTYDIRCTSCGYEYEQWHKVSEPHANCPECEGTGETVVHTAPPLNFKGKGWSTQDFYTSGYTMRNGTEGLDQKRIKEEFANE